MNVNDNDIDDLLKLSSLQEVQIPEKVDLRIEETLEKCKRTKYKRFGFKKLIATLTALATVAASGAVVYAGVTGKLNFNIGNTGNQKIDKNYNEVATGVGKTIDNEYMTLTLESMAADPAYLIFEYDIKFKEKAMDEIGEVTCDDMGKYNITLYSETTINNQKKEATSSNKQDSIQKISDNEFKLVEIYSIANIPENEMNVTKKMKSLVVYENSPYTVRLNVDISQTMTAQVKFENKEHKILAQTVLSNGSTLYIEKVSNSMFENYVLARTVSETKEYEEFWSKESQFMFEDYVSFAICDEAGTPVNFQTTRLENYYEKLQEGGSFIVQQNVDGETYFKVENNDLVRRQDVQLIRLAIEDGKEPEQINILPICRKLYNERNSSERDFYMQEDWYQVEAGNVNISETTQIGGAVTVTDICETEDEIIFELEKEGFAPSHCDLVVRVKNPKMNYLYGDREEIAKIDSDKNRVVFKKEVFGQAGMALLGLERLDNLEDLEFALFYNVKYDILAEEMSFNWDKTESQEVATIENIEFSEFVNDINDNLTSNHGNVNYEGRITEINDKYLKFYSERDKKELIISDPKQFEYMNRKNKFKYGFQRHKKRRFIDVRILARQ